MCDYAVLLSGGWNTRTATSKSKHNVKMVWRYLRKNHFKHENIVTFVGSQYSIERKYYITVLTKMLAFTYVESAEVLIFIVYLYK